MEPRPEFVIFNQKAGMFLSQIQHAYLHLHNEQVQLQRIYFQQIHYLTPEEKQATERAINESIDNFAQKVKNDLKDLLNLVELSKFRNKATP